MKIHAMNAESRKTTGKKTDSLRAEGKIPAVMYGFDTDSVMMTVDRAELERVYKNTGYSSILKLEMDGDEHHVLIQDLQRDPLTGYVIHADFRRIDMNEKVETSVRVVTVGVAPAAKDLGGTLVQSLEEVDVQALPNALVSELSLDVTSLKTFDDVLRVSDLDVPEGMEVLTEEDRTLAIVQPPRKEEELEALDEPVSGEIDVEIAGESDDQEGEGEESSEGESDDE